MGLGPSIVFYIRSKNERLSLSNDMTTDICREVVTFVVGNHGNVVTFVVGCDIVEAKL